MAVEVDAMVPAEIVTSPDYTPIISEEFYYKCMSKVLNFAFIMDFKFLIKTIFKMDDEIKSQVDHSVALASFISTLLEKGPFPSITDHKFINTLHSGVISYMQSHPELREVLNLHSIAKLESMLRFLLVRSVLYNEKFRLIDAEAAVNRFFTDDVEQFKSLMHIQEDEEAETVAELVTDYKNGNKSARAYFTQRIKKPDFKGKDVQKGALQVFEGSGRDTCSMKEALECLLKHMRAAADSSGLIDSLFDDSSENSVDTKMNKYFASRLKSNTEVDLIDFVRHLHDIRLQSHFFINMQNF